MMAFSVTQQQYSGPLDALLSLIEERRLSISEVSLAEVTDAYLAYVEALPALPLGETAQFILVASTLLLIKSRTLLPSVELTREETQSIEELERRLARYRFVRAGARLLRKRWGVAPLYTPRREPAPEYSGFREHSFNPGEMTLQTLHAALGRLVSLLPKPDRLAEAAIAPLLALEEVVAKVKNRLSSSLRARWSELTQSASKHERIVHFLAVLELVRSGSVSATQEKLFSDILLEAEALEAPRY